MYKIAVKAIIFRDDQVLILRKSKEERSARDTQGWDFPGGGLEASESLMDALIREVFEETKLKIRIIAPAYIYDEIHEDKHLIIAKFTCDMPVGEIVLSSEHIAYDWVSLKDLDTKDLPDWMEKEIRRAYSIYSLVDVY